MAEPGVNCEAMDLTGRHDWRVDPRQVIQADPEEPGTTLVYVTCSACETTSVKRSRRRWRGNPDDVRTWRPYVEGVGH